MTTPERIKARWTLAGIRVWTVIGVVVLAVAAMWLLSALSFALLPIALGLLIVLLLNGPVDMLARRIPRTWAVIVCYLSALAAIALLLFIIIPPVTAQIVQFVQAAQGYVTEVFAWWEKGVMSQQASPDSAWLRNAIIAAKDQLLAASVSLSTGVAQFALNAGGWIMAVFFNVTLGLMIAFYALADLPRLEREVFAIAGEDSREELSHAIGTTTRVVGGWLTGTLIQSVIVAVLMTVGLSLLGVPYAILVGLLGGLLNPVPYIGSTISWVIAAAAGMILGPWMALWAFLVAWAASNINGFVFAPRIMSESVDLHPLIVLAALLVGTSLFGVAGMVFSIPVVAVAKGMLLYRYEKLSENQLLDEDGVIFRSSKEEVDDDAESLGRAQAADDLASGASADQAPRRG